MKKFTLPLLCLLPLFSIAQLSIGLRAGVNVSNIHINEPSDFNEEIDGNYHYRTGVDLGINATWQTSEHFRVQSGLIYSRKGTSIDISPDSNEPNNKFDLHYLAIPLVAQYKILGPLWLSGGMEARYLLSAIGKYPMDEVTITDIWTRADLGLNAGITWQVAANLQLNIEYQYGLVNVGKKTTYTDSNGDPLSKQPKTTNRSIALTLGYAFLRS